MVVSVIMPFYKRINSLRESLEWHAHVLEKDDVELILVLDEPTQTSEVITLLKNYPRITCTIIENPNDHPWRNPAAAINVGVRAATGQFIMVCSPESVFAGNPIESFLSNWRPGTYCTGYVSFDMTKAAAPYGSLFVLRSDLEAVEGFDESYTTWGGDDDDIRKRLNLYGLKAISCVNALLLHHQGSRPARPGLKDRLARLALVDSHKINQPNWGQNFSNIVYRQGRM